MIPPVDTQGKRTFVQLVAVLLVTGGLRAAWAHRAGATDLPGNAVSTGALGDSAQRLAEGEARRTAPLRPGERLDPNRAGEEDLDRLPGVGAGTARAVVLARDSLPFTSLDDLLRVRGIGPATLERLTPHLELGPVPVGRPVAPRRARPPGLAAPGMPAPGEEGVDVNRATAEELTALPGVGPVLAGRIVEHRRAHGRFTGPEDLLPVPGIGPAVLEKMRYRLRF